MKKEMPTDPRQRHRQSRVTEENLRQWLHPQSFWPFSHACRPPCRCTGDWKVPDCSGWMPKSFGPQRHDHWNGRLGAVPQGGPSPTAHHGAAPPALVVLDPVTNPLIVECLRGFIHDELQAHLLAPVASNDLDKSGSTPALLPKALAVLAHIAASGDTLLFANDFPGGDGTQDQSTLSFGPKDVLLFSPHLLFGIRAHHRVHVFNGDGGAWLIRIFHQQRSPCRGVSADGSCTQRREPQLAGLDPDQKPEWPHRSSSTCDKEAQHGRVNLCPPPLLRVASPCHLHFHIGAGLHIGLQLGIDLLKGTKLLKGEGDPSHRTWLGSGAAPWNQPHLPPANPSQEPACG